MSGGLGSRTTETPLSELLDRLERHYAGRYPEGMDELMARCVRVEEALRQLTLIIEVWAGEQATFRSLFLTRKNEL